MPARQQVDHMAGLRELHREKRRQAICSSAIKLFARQGYEGTTVSAIAAHAKVAPSTVFNYFKTKSDILLEIIDVADQQAFSEIRENRANWNDPIKALVEVDRLVTIYECEMLPVNVWREVMPVWSLSPPPQLIALNDRIISLIKDVLLSLRDNGLIRAETDLHFVANFLNAYAAGKFWRDIQKGEFCIEDHVKHMTTAITILVDGIR